MANYRRTIMIQVIWWQIHHERLEPDVTIEKALGSTWECQGKQDGNGTLSPEAWIVRVLGLGAGMADGMPWMQNGADCVWGAVGVVPGGWKKCIEGCGTYRDTGTSLKGPWVVFKNRTTRDTLFGEAPLRCVKRVEPGEKASWDWTTAGRQATEDGAPNASTVWEPRGWSTGEVLCRQKSQLDVGAENREGVGVIWRLMSLVTR